MEGNILNCDWVMIYKRVLEMKDIQGWQDDQVCVVHYNAQSSDHALD